MEWTVTVTSEDFSSDAAVLERRRAELLLERLRSHGLRDLLGFATDGAIGVVFSVPTASPHESFPADTYPIRRVEDVLLEMRLRLGSFSGTLNSSPELEARRRARR
jgi:hypothetical protein